MAVPAFLNSSFRYKESLAVVDVQTIINDLIAECVTSGSPAWTTILGGTGVSPSTIQSPTRSDGLFFTVNMTRISATEIQFIVKDHNGVLVNNQTSTRLDIDVAGSTVHYYTGEFHLCVTAERATPEAFDCGIFDQSPEAINAVKGSYFASPGPRSNTSVLGSQGWDTEWVQLPAAAAYATGSNGIKRIAPAGTNTMTTISGALLFYPVEYNPGTNAIDAFMGRKFQALMVDSNQAFAAEFTVPIDVGPVTAVFKVAGFATAQNARIAYRKS